MKKVTARVMIDGHCKNCGADTSVSVALGGFVQVNVGGFFIRKYELFMEAELDIDDRSCPECGYDYFNG